MPARIAPFILIQAPGAHPLISAIPILDPTSPFLSRCVYWPIHRYLTPLATLLCQFLPVEEFRGNNWILTSSPSFQLRQSILTPFDQQIMLSLSSALGRISKTTARAAAVSVRWNSTRLVIYAILAYYDGVADLGMRFYLIIIDVDHLSNHM